MVWPGGWHQGLSGLFAGTVFILRLAQGYNSVEQALENHNILIYPHLRKVAHGKWKKEISGHLLSRAAAMTSTLAASSRKYNRCYQIYMAFD